MCVFFIFFTPTIPPLHPPNPPKIFPILKNHMCILSLINKIPVISAQILFILCKFHTPSIHPCYSINKWIGILFFWWGIWGWWGELVYLWWIFYSKSVIRIDERFWFIGKCNYF